MKNSTSKNSSAKAKKAEVTKVKPKHVERKAIGGMIFYRKDVKPLVVGFQRWIEQGCPDNVVIYDELWVLLANKVPMLDAIQVDGKWVRLPELKAKAPWSGTPNSFKESKFLRSSKLPLEFSAVLAKAAPKKIGTRDIVC